MPHLPDGSFARGEKWFAKRGRPKNHTEEFWLKYEGFGCQAFEAGEIGITALHKAAAFGWPQQAQFLLARNAEIVSARSNVPVKRTSDHSSRISKDICTSVR
ncbi:unnamed protein product [Cladocopium goreaui]|uniref:Ankyrin repeat domain-containing protein n=1 Tax=Cladocopium goreaui TaxID=2562237 RepID=A0A9P1BX78_9DINO|nr:unnamed protein product [Cladocopium goreaui]